MWSVATSVTAAVGYPTQVEPRWLDKTTTRVSLGGLNRVSCRILHLSDLHASWVVPLDMIDRAIESGLSANPDIVCVTGDFITSRYDYDARAYAATLRRLSATRPTFAVLGNHDGGVWAKERRGSADHAAVSRMLEDAHITLLHNRSQQVAVREGRLTLLGVGDLWSREIDADRAFRSVAPGGPVVLLSHNPDSKDVLARWHWDLMLCGHTHGGQVIIPFEGPRYAPVQDKRFVAGLHPWRGRQIYTTRGVGNHMGVRFLCRPEVSVLDIESHGRGASAHA